LKKIVAEDVVDHTLPPGGTQGREGLLDAVALFRSAFPDLKVTVEKQVASDDSPSRNAARHCEFRDFCTLSYDCQKRPLGYQLLSRYVELYRSQIPLGADG
jgi:hypothetical protein